MLGDRLARDVLARAEPHDRLRAAVAQPRDDAQSRPVTERCEHRRRFAQARRGRMRGGERTKSLTQLGKVYDWMAAQGLDRQSAVFAIGGGVIGDLVGFAAATYLRGLAFYQVPTTLLSQVDSSVGGKII